MQTIIDQDYIYVEVPYPERGRAKFLGGTWNNPRKMWRFPTNIHVMRKLVQTFPNLKHDQAFMDAGKRMRADIDRLLAIRALHDHPGDWRLRPYQRVDVAYLKELKAAGVFNEQRTGKTPTILTVVRELELKTVLVVCPASLLHNWKKEIGIWVGDHTACQVVKGTPKQRAAMYERMQGRFTVVSYETLRNDIKHVESIRLDCVIVDEAHRLRNRDTKQSKALYSLQADRKYALTGTPTVQHGTDLFGILQFLHPERYKSYWEWTKRYFNVYETYGGMEVGNYREATKNELLETVGMMCVQRKRKDVMQWLPDKTYIELPVSMDTKQRKVYQEMLDTFTVELDNGELIADAPTVLAQLTRLRQICLDPGLLEIDAPSAKTNAILEYLEDNPQPVVVMSMFTSYLHRLANILQSKKYKVGILHGGLNSADKAKAVADFQSGHTDYLLCNIISAGVGHTLDRADTIIFTDKAWNPTDQQQAEDRIVPVAEDRNHAINIVTFPIADTVDSMIDEILKRKENITEVINSGAKEAIMRLVKGER